MRMGGVRKHQEELERVGGDSFFPPLGLEKGTKWDRLILTKTSPRITREPPRGS